MHLQHFLDRYILQHDLTKGAIVQYRVAVNVFERWLGRPAILDDLSDDTLNRWLCDYARTSKPHTVASKRRSILVLRRSAADENLIPESKIRVRKIKLPETIKDVWTHDQIQRLAEACAIFDNRLPMCEINQGLYLTTIVRAAWDTGLRLGDLLSLDRSHVVDGWQVVRQSKTGRTRMIRLTQSTQQLLSRTFDEIAVPRRLLWPNFTTGSPRQFARALSAMVRTVADDLGLLMSDGPFKKIRRSTITAVELSQPGAGYLHAGHTDPGTTTKWYLNPEATQTNRPVPAEL